MAKLKAGDQFGPWTLLEELGSGGNGEVWKADAGDRVGAIKIVNRKPHTEPYRRFRREVQKHRELSDEGFFGVLKVLDSFDVEADGDLTPGWLVTELATPMTEKLSVANIRERVEAVSRIADTLGRLHERGISHRDIKPDNLFFANHAWVIGDFGLVDFEKSVPLTEAGRALGPRYFMAPEMLGSPDTADGCKADVYSLAKTLWVLLTGQRYPIPGMHVYSQPLARASTWAGPDVNQLDLLIERATNLDPAVRPTASELSREVYAWLQGGSAGSSTESRDCKEISRRLANSLKPGESLQEAYKLREDQRRQLKEKMGAILNELLEQLQRDGISATLVADGPQFANEIIGRWVIPKEHGTSIGICLHLNHEIPASGIILGTQARSAWLRSGFAFRTSSDGEVMIGAGHVVGAIDRYRELIWNFDTKLALGSAEADRFCEGLGGSLAHRMADALEKYHQMVTGLTS
jgi:serine/threonine protein kinase